MRYYRFKFIYWFGRSQGFNPRLVFLAIELNKLICVVTESIGRAQGLVPKKENMNFSSVDFKLPPLGKAQSTFYTQDAIGDSENGAGENIHD